MYEHLIADRRCWTLTRTHKEKIHGLNVTSMLLCTTLKSMLTSNSIYRLGTITVIFGEMCDIFCLVSDFQLGLRLGGIFPLLFHPCSQTSS